MTEDEMTSGDIDKMVTVHYFGDIGLRATSDIVDGEQLDTRIEVGGKKLCYVAGNQKEEFITKLNDLVEEYRI